MSALQTAALLGSLAASVAAHGRVSGIVAGGVWYQGYDPSFQYQNPPPTVIGWSDPEDLGNGFIPPSNYSTPDIICHLGATVAGTAAKVAAGSVVELQWTPWPESHHGPVIDYLAPVSGDFADVDKTALEFFKIDEVGLVDDSSAPGIWGSDQLIANNNSWAVTIPKSIAPGNYVLRHEIIGLHSAGNADGAQNYPQCINIEVTGSGTDKPSGTVGQKLYTNTAAPGVLVNIYQSLSTYVIPGPSLYSGAVSIPQTAVPTSGGAAPTKTAASSAATSVAAVSTSKAAASTHAVSSTSKAAATTHAASSGVSTVNQAATSSGCTKTITITKSKSTVKTAQAVVSRTTPASYVAPIESIATELPSSVLTATIPTTLPSKTAAASSSAAQPTGGASDGSWGSVPSKPLPEGWTLKDLLEWVSYLLGQVGNTGVHQRDFSRR